MKKYMSPSELGHAFEDRVRRALIRNGYALKKQNKWMQNQAPEKDTAKKREYDLEMFKFNRKEKQFYVIECKAHYKQTTFVGLGQVKEFNHKLESYNGRYANKMMVTDTDFTKPAKNYALKRNILLVNGKKLIKMEKQSDGLLAGVLLSTAVKIIPMNSRSVSAGLGGIVNRLVKNYLK